MLPNSDPHLRPLCFAWLLVPILDVVTVLVVFPAPLLELFNKSHYKKEEVIIKKKVEENSNSKAGLLSVFYLVGFAWKRRRGFRECAGQLLQQRHSSRLGWENIRTFYLGAN